MKLCCAHFKEFRSSNCFINSVMNSIWRIMLLDVSDSDGFTDYNLKNQHYLFNCFNIVLFTVSIYFIYEKNIYIDVYNSCTTQ